MELLLGDLSTAKEKLGWAPTVKFGELVGMMVRLDLQDQGREAHLKEGGWRREAKGDTRRDRRAIRQARHHTGSS